MLTGPIGLPQLVAVSLEGPAVVRLLADNEAVAEAFRVRR